MKNFKELDKRNVHDVESSLSQKWQEMDILNLSIENRAKNKNWVFYDGPIYANAKPGIHHVLAKTIKDSFCKYKTMQGYRVLRKIGLDTHGLPIEVNVEKKLGFKSKADIEAFGIENFCKECNKATATNIGEVNDVTHMMGQFIDCEHPYITCTNDYIESEWWLLKEIDKKNLLYHGNKVLPYCPRCGTELSANEVSQGYQQDSVNTVIVPFKRCDAEEYFLVWTTTPWTLIANVGLCVHPNLTYVRVKSDEKVYILAESLVEKVFDGKEYEILSSCLGKDLEGISYEQLLPFVNVEGNAFKVVSDSYVTSEDGTGIVHLAPAYGEDDNRVCKENGLAFLNVVDKDGTYIEGPWKGTLVTDNELEITIVKWLKENNKLFKKIKIVHDYPHCWRCKQPLIYYAKPAWYIKTTAYKEEIIKANEGINWYPSYVGTKRFNNWLSNMVDWGISRNRYWGCPMPIWICDSCGEKKVIGSRAELKENLIEDVDIYKTELHRPYVDNLHLKCPHCGGVMTRIKDVLDVWFDSGAMPYAQYHYPFENKELFESQFPADFIAEGVDQTRGWFNSLLCISTLVSGVSSFKNVVVNDMVLDSYGKKMSKSVGNIIDPVKELTDYGADIIRFYMMMASPVWTPLKYDANGYKEVYSKFINPLKNTYSFFQMYANTDNIDTDECEVPYEDREEIDKWLLSKYNHLVKYVTASFEEFDLNKVTKALANFVSEDLSNWYIRRNRKRFWASDLDTSKKSVYITTYEVLVGLCKLVAPICPFISEEIYQNLTGEKSVHLADYPKCDETLFNDELEEKMDLVRDLIRLGRNVREDVKIKVREPLQTVYLDGKNLNTLKDLVPLIKEELNVKDVVFISDLTSYMNFLVKPNFKEVGKVLGSKMKDFQNMLTNLTEEEITSLENGKEIHCTLNGEDMLVSPSMVDIRVSAKENMAVAMENNHFVILDTTRSESLILEGIAREFVSKVQNLRKEKGFNITDRIVISYYGTERLDKVLKEFKNYIMDETLAVSFISNPDIKTKYDLNGEEALIDIAVYKE